MNSRINICILLVTLVLPTSSFGQVAEAKVEKVVLVITLDADRIQSLQINGALKTAVPAEMVNRVAAIRFRMPTSFLDETIPVETRTDKRLRTLATVIDDSVLERIAYQPVEMRVYNSNFSSVLIVLDQVPEKLVGTLPGQLAAPPQRPTDSPPFFVRINELRGIEGTLKDLQELKVSTEFGEVRISLSNVSGIRFQPSVDNADQTIVFVVSTTGDRFSGAITQNSFVVQSRWGEKELKFSEIESLTRAANARFVPNTAVTGQWKLVQESLSPRTTGPRLFPSQR